MKIFLLSAYPVNICNPPGWLKSRSTAITDICTNDPELADVILFAECHQGHDPYFRKVLKHRLYKKYRSKCVLYHDADKSITAIPTITPSIEKWQYNRLHKQSFHYIARVSENVTIDQAKVNLDIERTFLYSFLGSITHRVRRKIIALDHPANTYVKDTNGIRAWELSEAEKFAYEQEYFEVMSKSSFILAPRGIGPCSYRLFESMQMGRAPVIISDQWVQIPGIDWSKFSITIKESDIRHISAVLNERKDEAIVMGKLAREAWEQFFSPGVSLERIAMVAKELVSRPYTLADAITEYAQFIKNPWHLKNLLRYKKNKWKRR